MVKFGQEKKFFIILSLLAFTIFALTSDGHRYTFDEDVMQQQSMWIATMTPDPRFIEGESRELFQFPEYFPNNQRPICNIGILCSQVPIGSTLTQVPFILLNQNFDFITHDTVVFTEEDFPDPHYVYWRNSAEPDFTFLELFYGPFFGGLAVGMFYLISRTYGFSTKISTIISILFITSTPLWAYAQTSLNIVPITFLVLLGFFFFKKFLITASSRYMLFSGIVFGFGFLVRNDTILFIIPLVGFCIFTSLKNSNIIKYLDIKIIQNFLFHFPNTASETTNFKRIVNSLFFMLPMIASYFIQFLMKTIGLRDAPASAYTGIPTLIDQSLQHYISHMYAMLFSPGVGLLIFAPILFTMFLGFFDFFKKNKMECILFASFLFTFLIFYAWGEINWHGLNAWGMRYLTSIIPFLLLPLAFSMEKRLNKKFYSILIGLGLLGVIFNISNLVTDVSWFIWGIMGSGRGLYELGHVTQNLWVHPLVIWTFDYSQLTHALKYAFMDLHPDIFWLKVWGIQFYSILSIILISSFTFCLIYLNKKSTINVKKLQ